MARAAPQPRDPEATRASILDAAERVFIEKGFAGASMRDIATTCGTHQSLIHHHFGTKQELWQTVVARYVEQYLAKQLPFLSPTQLDENTLPRALELDFRFWQTRPELLRLETWTALEGSNPFGDKRDALYAPFVPVVRALQGAGIIRDDILAVHLITLAAASVSFWFQNRSEICAALGADEKDLAVDDRYLEDVLKILFRGGAGGPVRTT